MKRILIDTNFLLIPYQFKVDIISEFTRIMDEPFELCILDDTIVELDNIIKKGGKFADSARLGLKLCKNFKTLKTKRLYMELNSRNPVVDDIILHIADENTYVATQDKALKNRLKEKQIPVIILRGKKYLELTCSTKQRSRIM